MTTVPPIPPAPERSEGDGTHWDDPLPLGMSTQNLPEFPVSALGPVLGAYVTELAEAMQTPVDLPGTVVLGVLAACVGGRVNVQCPTHVEPTNLFVVPVMPPASRKSGVVQAGRAPLAEAEQQLRDDRGQRVLNSHTAWEVASKRAENLKTAAAKSGEHFDLLDAQDAVREAEEKRNAIEVWPRLMTSDATPEAMVTLLAEQGGAIAAISAEAGVFASLTGRYSKTPNLDPLLMAHAGDTITVDRRSRAPEYVTSPALTIVCSIQPYALRELVGRDDFAGRGLLARVLWSLPRDNAGYRRVRGVAPVSDGTAEAFRTLIVDLAVSAANLVGPVTLSLSETATTVFYDHAEQVERLLHPAGALGKHRLTREWGGKLAGAVARIAGGLHAAAYGLTGEISGDTMRAAVRLGDYYRAHAIVALADGEDEDTAQARALLGHLVEKQLETFKVRDLRAGPKSLRKSENLMPVIDDLIGSGWVQESPAGGWLVHPDAAAWLDKLERGDTGDRGDSQPETAGHGAYDTTATAVAPAGDAGDGTAGLSTAAAAVAPVAPPGDSMGDIARTGLSSANNSAVAPVAPVARVCLDPECGKPLAAAHAAAGVHPWCFRPWDGPAVSQYPSCPGCGQGLLTDASRERGICVRCKPTTTGSAA